jgi:6-pyruvoyltetrahydropterin/6-carboxytetrahydropterin synthase
MYEVTVRHNFETAHRLPHLEGKCQSLHGHSWWAAVTVQSPVLRPGGVVVEFGHFKKVLREWIDTNLDHGTMLGYDDPLVPVLRAHGCKVYVMDMFPTVEEVAADIGFKAQEMLATIVRAPDARVTRCAVRETHVNEAAWSRDD